MSQVMKKSVNQQLDEHAAAVANFKAALRSEFVRVANGVVSVVKGAWRYVLGLFS